MPEIDEQPVSGETTDAIQAGEQEPKDGDPIADDEDLQQTVKRLCLKLCYQDDRYARLVEVRDCVRARLYWRGQQYIWWSDKDQRMYLSSQTGVINYPNLFEASDHFEYVTNLYQARGLSIIGSLIGAVPTTEFFPDDANDINDVETAEGYTKLSRLLDRWNPPKLLMQEIGYAFWCDGVVGLHCEYIEDGERFGYDEQETLEAGQATEAGVTAAMPVEGEPEKKPRGREVISAHGALELKRPIWAKNQSEFMYLCLEREKHYAQLRSEFPDKADKIKAGDPLGNDGQFERNARLSLLEGTQLRAQSAGAQQCLATEIKAWLRPSAFWDNSVAKKDREKLLALYPRGGMFHFAGPTYLTSRQESMDDSWVVRHAMPGDGQHRNGTGTSLLSLQDRFNTSTNIGAEMDEYGIPITYRDKELFSQEANQDQRSEPGNEIDVVIRPDVDIRTRIMQVRADSMSEDSYRRMMDVMGPVSELVTGDYPALAGAGNAAGAAGETLGGYQMQRDAALGRVGIPYTQIRQAFDDIRLLGCKEFCACTNQDKVSWAVKSEAGDWTSESVDVATLEGEASTYPETDENFPENWSQQRSTFMQVMDSPFGPQILGQPENAKLATKLIGIPELEVPGAALETKVMGDISDLVQVLPGEDGSPEIELEVDPVVDMPAAAVTIVQDYILKNGRELKRKNPTGYLNLRTHLAKLRQAAASQQGAPPTKPLSESLNIAFKDLVPEAQAQILATFGINVSPQDFLAKVALDKAAKPQPRPPLQATGSPVAQATNAQGVQNAG